MKRLTLPSSQRHLDIYLEDWDYINTRWGKAGGGRQAGMIPVGTANLIRSIIHQWVLAHRAGEEAEGQSEESEAP